MLVLVPLLIAGAVFGIISLTKKSGTMGAPTELPFTKSDPYVFTGNGFLYMKGTSLYYKDLVDSKKDYSFIVSASDVKLTASLNISALYNSSAVQIVGAPSPIERTGQILNVRCGSKHVVILREDGNGSTSMQIFDTAGNQKDEIDIPKGTAYIVDFGFTAAAEDVLWTLTVDTASEIPLSTITTYDLAKGSTTGVLTVHHQLIESLQFTQNSIFAIGTNDLIRYNNASEVYRLRVYGWKLLDFSASGASAKPLFLFAPRNASSALSTVKVYSVAEAEVASDQVMTFQLPENTLSAFLAGGNLVACTGNALYTYAMNGSKSSVELGLTVDGPGAVKLSENRMLLFQGEKLYLASIR